MLLFLLSFLSFFTISAFAEEHIIHWDPSDSLFAGNIEAEMTVRMGDRLKILCPKDSSPEDEKYLIAYQVSEMSYINCALETSRRMVMSCGSNGAFRRPALINVISHSATPGAILFSPGNSYYWISTSGGSPMNMNTSSKGLCVTKNMRFRLNVIEALPTTTQAPREVVTTPEFHPRARIGKLPPGLDDSYVREVAQMAIEGKTGTFLKKHNRHTNERKHHHRRTYTSSGEEVRQSAWDPIALDSFTDLTDGEKAVLYEAVGPRNHEDFAFVIQEDVPQLHARSYPLESSSSLFTYTSMLLLSIAMLW